jgi:hypothetical protein
MSSTIQDADGAVASRIELTSRHGLALPCPWLALLGCANQYAGAETSLGLMTLFLLARSRCFQGCLTTALQLVKHALSRGNARSFCPLRKDFEPLASSGFC